jgi:MFS family permease
MVAGWLMDRDYRSAEATYKEAHGMSDECKISPKAIPGDFPIEKSRLRHVFWIIGLLASSVALYGAAFSNSPITSRREWMAVLLVLQFFIAASANMIFAINSTLITDLHPGKGAGATAIYNFARCTMSAGAVPLSHYMIKKFQTMPTFCALGAAVLILCVPLAIVSRTRGTKWRRDRMKKAQDWQGESLGSTKA